MPLIPLVMVQILNAKSRESKRETHVAESDVTDQIGESIHRQSLVDSRDDECVDGRSDARVDDGVEEAVDGGADVMKWKHGPAVGTAGSTASSRLGVESISLSNDVVSPLFNTSALQMSK